ncbi:MAG: hypothetical protein WBK55_00130 [Alphaproteobacteria bacterium]
MKDNFNKLSDFQREVLALLKPADTELSIIELMRERKSDDLRYKAYVDINTLKDKGFITSRNERSSQYVALGFYKITDQGLNALRDSQPVPVA